MHTERFKRIFAVFGAKNYLGFGVVFPDHLGQLNARQAAQAGIQERIIQLAVLLLVQIGQYLRYLAKSGNFGGGINVLDFLPQIVQRIFIIIYCQNFTVRVHFCCTSLLRNVVGAFVHLVLSKYTP